MDLIIISIGALSKNPLWNERIPVRPSHATTTLLRSTTDDGKPLTLLIDPSLPGDALDARLFERAGIHADAVTHVFLTNWRPVHRRGLEKFAHATWWVHDAEMAAVAEALDRAEEQLVIQDQTGQETGDLLKKERALFEKISPAPEELADGIQLYPLAGYTPGQCGLIITTPTLTTILAGDAVPTAAHFAAGQVFPDAWDIAKAKESLLDVYEVADLIIPGHDNLFVAPRKAGL